MAVEGELDLLIATDCISEGQNLQDCDWLINYDIHWNPVRIIQRFGRIDRIGSPNERIQLVNFWPNMELEEYINLEQRVSGRMVLLDISATGEENLIEQQSGDPMNDLEYRRKQLLKAPGRGNRPRGPLHRRLDRRPHADGFPNRSGAVRQGASRCAGEHAARYALPLPPAMRPRFRRASLFCLRAEGEAADAHPRGRVSTQPPLFSARRRRRYGRAALHPGQADPRPVEAPLRRPRPSRCRSCASDSTSSRRMARTCANLSVF